MFQFDQDKALVGDVDRIQQVLLNLLSNARKFVPKQQGLILVKAELSEWDSKVFLRVSIKDNGPGISQEDLKKLFKPFSKLASTSQLNPNGSGLGLYNCKLICTSLGGDITIESQL